MTSEQIEKTSLDESMEISQWALDGIVKAQRIGFDLDDLLTSVRIAWHVNGLSVLIWKQGEPRNEAEMTNKMQNCCCFNGEEQGEQNDR